MKKIEISEKDFHILIISELRYAMERDNHLAPFTFTHMFKKYIGKVSKENQEIIIKQVVSEIMFNLGLKDYDYKEFWKSFLNEIDLD